jgi:hypothetical protein
MSDHKSRVTTIQAILTGTPVSNAPNYTVIRGELNDVMSAKRIADVKRRQLLQVLHSTRALDSALSAFIGQRWSSLMPPVPPNPRRSLGGYLVWLSTHTETGRIARLPIASQSRYQRTIVDIRNRYMHEAGATPRNDAEIDRLLSEMQLCISQVVAL